jgi:predicted Zn-dependent protease with MMP-like domain
MPIKISPKKFESLVVQALKALPAFFKVRLENIEVLITDRPTEEELAEAGLEPDELVLGLYQGIPLTERTSDYGLVLPDTITLYRQCIAEVCDTPEDVVREVQQTVKHEIAHYFGISDERLEELGAY